jgi:histidine ammonia-lyase
VRSISPRLAEDRPLEEDIAEVASAVRDGSLVAAVEQAAGELL